MIDYEFMSWGGLTKLSFGYFQRGRTQIHFLTFCKGARLWYVSFWVVRRWKFVGKNFEVELFDWRLFQLKMYGPFRWSKTWVELELFGKVFAWNRWTFKQLDDWINEKPQEDFHYYKP